MFIDQYYEADQKHPLFFFPDSLPNNTHNLVIARYQSFGGNRAKVQVESEGACEAEIRHKDGSVTRTTTLPPIFDFMCDSLSKSRRDITDADLEGFIASGQITVLRAPRFKVVVTYRTNEDEVSCQESYHDNLYSAAFEISESLQG